MEDTLTLEPGDIIWVYDNPIWIYVGLPNWVVIDQRASCYGEFASVEGNLEKIVELVGSENVDVYRYGVPIF